MGFSGIEAKIAVLAILLSGIAGCASPTNPAPATTESGPTTSASETTSPPTNVTTPPVRIAGIANVTDCRGAVAFFYVPADFVRDDVPESYAIDVSDAGTAYLLLQMTVCGKVSLDGVDAGPSTHSAFLVLLEATQEMEAEQISPYYLFELRLDNEEFRQWFIRQGYPATTGLVKHTQTPLAADLQDVKTTMSEGNAVVYDLQAYPDSGQIPYEDQTRIYYGSDAKTQYWNETLGFRQSGVGAGDLEVLPDSKIAQVLEGQMRWTPPTSALPFISRLIELPSSRQG